MSCWRVVPARAVRRRVPDLWVGFFRGASRLPVVAGGLSATRRPAVPAVQVRVVRLRALVSCALVRSSLSGAFALVTDGLPNAGEKRERREARGLRAAVAAFTFGSAWFPPRADQWGGGLRQRLPGRGERSSWKGRRRSGKAKPAARGPERGPAPPARRPQRTSRRAGAAGGHVLPAVPGVLTQPQTGRPERRELLCSESRAREARTPGGRGVGVAHLVSLSRQLQVRRVGPRYRPHPGAPCPGAPCPCFCL